MLYAYWMFDIINPGSPYVTGQEKLSPRPLQLISGFVTNCYQSDGLHGLPEPTVFADHCVVCQLFATAKGIYDSVDSSKIPVGYFYLEVNG